MLGVLVVAVLLIVTAWFLWSFQGSGVEGRDKALRDAKNRNSDKSFWY